MPALAARTEAFLNKELTWSDLPPTESHKITKFKALFNRIDPKKVDEMLESSKESALVEVKEQTQPAQNATELSKDPIEEIDFDDFVKVDMRVARIISVKRCQGE